MPVADIAPVCVPMDAVESIQITGVDIAVQNIVVDVDIVEARVDIRTVTPVDEWARSSNPASAPPTVVKRPAAPPIPPPV